MSVAEFGGPYYAKKHVSQIGQKRRAKYREEMHIYGRKAGTTMIRTKTSRSSSGMISACAQRMAEES